MTSGENNDNCRTDRTSETWGDSNVDLEDPPQELRTVGVSKAGYRGEPGSCGVGTVALCCIP